jgi:hypothetical protein
MGSLTRLFPQNITPKGTNVEQGFKNDDNEIKRILDILSESGSLQLFGSKRQSILYGSTDSSGNPNFLVANGLNVTIDGSTKPIILAFANGFNSLAGTVDTLGKIDGTVNNAWTLPANGTYYLYVDKDINTGLLSYGYTATPDTYAKVAPTSPILDQCYFNVNEMKMYHYNGSAWEQNLRVFVGSVVTTDTAATVTIYPMTSKATYLDYINGKKTTELSPNVLQRNKEYTAGEIAFSVNLPSWARLECVDGGKTALAEPTWGTIAGVLVTDGTATWIIDDVRDGGLPGDMSYKMYLKTGHIKANGATVNRADYPRLFKLATDNSLFNAGTFTGTTAVSSTTISGISTTDIAKARVGMTISGTGITTGTTITAISTTSITISVVATASGTVTITYSGAALFPGLFGIGDGSTTFVLPNLSGLFLEGSDVAGKAIAAGLPNITGSFSIANESYIGGAFYESTSFSGNGQNSQRNFAITLNAARSSAIYGNSTTVQPPAITMIPQIKY